MSHISYFLQHATVESQICHGTERVWHMDLFFFYSSFSLITLSSSPSAIHRLHLHSLTYLFLLLLQLFTTSISTLPYSFFFPFPFCSLSPLCSISDAADSLFSFSPSCRFKNLKVANFLSILSQSRRFAVCCSQSCRFAVLRVVEILSTIADSLFSLATISP